MLEVACRGGDGAPGRRFFLLDEKTYKRFTAALASRRQRTPFADCWRRKRPGVEGRREKLGAPEHLSAKHDLAAFDSGCGP